MINRRRQAGSAPKYSSTVSPRNRSNSDTETNDRRNELGILQSERKPSLKKLKSKILRGKNNLMEKRRQISEGVDKKINQMKNKVKQRVIKITKSFPKRKGCWKATETLSVLTKQENTATERTLEVTGMLLM